MGRKLCLNCQEKWTLSTYCSKDCYKEYRKSMALRNNLERKNCLHCGNEFQPTTDANLYCSHRCCTLFNRARLQKTKMSDFSIFHRDGFRCIYCGKSSIEDGVKLNVEHINPIVIGGLTVMDNLITACQGCNVSKNITVLAPDIVIRIINVVLSRNKGLNIKQFAQLEKQLLTLQGLHKGRIDKLVKNS